jgi:hypothetical protein
MPRTGSCTFLLAVILIGCTAGGTPSPSDATVAETKAGANDWFIDRALDSGIDFVHVNGMSGEFYFPENMAPGVGLLDYDNDGDLDLYLVQGRMLGHSKALDSAVSSPGDVRPSGGRLLRNDLTPAGAGPRTLHFTDVTAASGIDARGYGMGVAAGDVDNDGCVDLYLTNFGPNQLFHNRCDGTFADVSKVSGTGDPGFSVSASFVDYDRDGWLDLYVGNYLDYTIERNQTCFRVSGERDYCPPAAYPPQRDRLYHNNGNGTFTDVTTKALTGGDDGPGLGVATADFNRDGWLDIYVANDNRDNLLWLNQRDGTFRNTALLAGVALTAEGKAEASMGVDAGDFDNDGDDDLWMTELTGEGGNLYVNDGTGTFEDRSARSGLGPRSLPYTGFGTTWLDFDNDGWLDVLTVNGTIAAIEALLRANDPLPLRQKKQLFRNRGDGRFEDVSDRAGAVFQRAEVGRGAAFGDVDNDGDVDVLVGNDAGSPALLINQIGGRKHWLGLRLVSTQARTVRAPGTAVAEGGPRDAYGARVAVRRTGGPVLWRRARADGSYASANDPRVLVGLGDSTEAPGVRVTWPSGRVEEWATVPIDRYTTLREGGGKPEGTAK